MTDPSITIESISLQDPLARKMQLLQTENNSFRQQREAFESNIRQYVKTISQLDDQLLDLQRQNQQLTQTNRQNCLRNRKLELDLQRCSNEYKCLYNHIHCSEKRSQRDLIIKEMQLTNQLNEIQYNGYSKIIIQLKENLSRKNQEITNLNSENTNLKQKILQSTYEYHQQMAKLKEEIIRLKAQQSNTVTSWQQSRFEESTFEKMISARVDCFREQMEILQKENKKLSKELLELKQELHIYKSEAEWLNIEIENIKSQREVSIDFTEVRNILNENVTLKRMLEEQTFKFNTFIRNNPALSNQASEIDLTATFNDVEGKYQLALLNLQKKGREIAKIRKQISQVTKLKQDKQEQHLKFKTMTIKVIEKLKKIIKNYVPCFNLYGYSDFGLEPEESKLVQENGADIYKEYDRISTELIQKNAQISRLQSKITALEAKGKDWESNLAQEKEKYSQLKEENKRLLLSLQSITQKMQEQHEKQVNLGEYPQQQSPRFGQQSMKSPSTLMKKRHYFPDLNRQQSLTKLDSICDLALSLQKDRQQMLSCIRSKDAIIAEANAELKVLRSECNPKVYQFQSLPSSLYISQSNHQVAGQSESNTSQLLQNQAQQYQNLKEQISSMAMLYQNQIYLLQQEHTNKYSELTLKYTKLLSENHELQQRIKTMEKNYQEKLEKRSEHQSKKSESIQEDNAEGIDLIDNLPRDDKNVISEATIQIINDLLKKYQKEFSRFSSLYQAELTKTRELKRNNFEELDHLSVQKQLHEKIERIQQILIEKEETIRMLQEEVRVKQGQFKCERERYEQTQALSEERMAQLQTRLNHINSELQILQKRGIDTISTVEGTSSKSISFILAALSSKNQQIIALKQALQQKDRYSKQLAEEIKELKTKVHDQHSELQEEEFRQFKKLVQEGELSYVLEKAADLLAHRNQNEQ